MPGFPARPGRTNRGSRALQVLGQRDCRWFCHVAGAAKSRRDAGGTRARRSGCWELRLARTAVGSAFGFGGYVAFGEAGAFAEEELLHLLFHDFLRVGIEGIEAIFVHNHF